MNDSCEALQYYILLFCSSSIAFFTNSCSPSRKESHAIEWRMAHPYIQNECGTLNNTWLIHIYKMNSFRCGTLNDAWLWVNDESHMTLSLSRNKSSDDAWLWVTCDSESMTHPYIQNECVSQWCVIDLSKFTNWMWERHMTDSYIQNEFLSMWEIEWCMTHSYIKNEVVHLDFWAEISASEIAMSHVANEWAVSPMNEWCHNESCRKWMSHVANDWVISRRNELCLAWMSRVWYEWVMSHVIWMTHVSHEMNGSCRMSHIQNELVHLDFSCLT